MAEWELFLLTSVGYKSAVRKDARDKLYTIQTNDAQVLQVLHEEVAAVLASGRLVVPTPTPLPEPTPYFPQVVGSKAGPLIGAQSELFHILQDELCAGKDADSFMLDVSMVEQVATETRDDTAVGALAGTQWHHCIDIGCRELIPACPDCEICVRSVWLLGNVTPRGNASCQFPVCSSTTACGAP